MPNPTVLLGIDAGGAVTRAVDCIVRGKAIIATEESRSNAAYALMPTPDRGARVLTGFFEHHWGWVFTVGSQARRGRGRTGVPLGTRVYRFLRRSA